MFDCTDCGAPAAIERDRQQYREPTATGTIHRTQHADGTWCETFVPRKESAM